MAAGWLALGDARERLREAVPPGTAVPEERAKLLCASNRLFNSRNRVMRSIELLRTTVVFIRYASP
jgi:hypothetical protein